MRRLGLVLATAATLALAACAPTLQTAERPAAGFTGPRLEPQAHAFVSFDGARLGLTEWDAKDGAPWAVIVGVHGMDDYANAFHLAAPWWAEHGITTLAYDQRGFGRSPQRGVWSPEELSVEDLRTIVALARAKYPGATIAVAGESLGGAVAVEAFASADPPAADRLILLSPAVWGWSTQPVSYRIALWVADHFDPDGVVKPPSWVTKKIWASDNKEELYAMGRDPLMLWGARSDALYGLVETMDRAWRETSELKTSTLYLYGAHDEIIPKRAAFEAAARLPAGDRTAYYADGWHLLLRDLQAKRVWADVAAYIRDPSAPLPSGAPPIPPPSARPAGVVAAPPPA
ncbi:MAG TPA: alpha/beta fold hydrolase [Caulobacteraceae bacterium]|jgi:alpha-beta hydrolase superfamily lysophospholipase